MKNKKSKSKVLKSKSKTLLSDLPPKGVVLLSTNNLNYSKVNLELLKLIEKKKAYGIYITINRPYSSIIQTLYKKKISYKNIYFIDTITETAGGEPLKSEKVLYMSSPISLTDLGVAIDEMLHLLKDKGDVYLILDSVSMLLIYNNKASVVEFIHFITSKLRILNINGVLINIEEQNKEINAVLMQFCDKEIKVT